MLRISTSRSLRCALVTGFIFASASLAFGQGLDTAQSNIVFQAYKDAAAGWVRTSQGYASVLFKLLAALDFAYTAAFLALEGHELNTYLARILRKLMTIAFFAYLLANGLYWMGAISSSFIKVGQAGSGISAISPAEILQDGFHMTVAIMKWALSSATTIGITSFAPLLPVLFGLLISILLLLGYGVVAIHFIVTQIEGLVVIGSGYIFLGFGGSQWTRPYVERYISLSVSLGTRLMVLYLVVGLGHKLATQWVTILTGMKSLAVVSDPINAILNMAGVLCGALTFVGVALMAPRLVASHMSGSLSFSGGEVLGAASGAALGATAALAAVPTGGASMAAGAATKGVGTIAAGAQTTAAGVGGQVAPPAAALGGGGGGGASLLPGGGMSVPPPAAVPSGGGNVPPPGGASPGPANGGSSAAAAVATPPPSPASGASQAGIGAAPPPAAGPAGGATTASPGGAGGTASGNLPVPGTGGGTLGASPVGTQGSAAAPASTSPAATSPAPGAPAPQPTPSGAQAAGTTPAPSTVTPPATSAASPPASATKESDKTPSSGSNNASIGSTARKAQEGVHQAIGSLNTGPVEAPPPQIRIEGDGH